MVTTQNHPDVLISEVGPRDGLQSVKATMPPCRQRTNCVGSTRWWVAAGLREIEVCSFVPAKHLPQMVDVAGVVRHALTYPGSALTFAVGTNSSAPGQVPIEDLNTVLGALKKSLSGK